MTLDEMYVAARAAAKESSRWVYRRSYIGGAVTIACREPGPHELYLMSVCTRDYGKHAGVTTQAARAHLRTLTNAGRIEQERRSRTGAVLRFVLTPAENLEIGREVIAELVAEGLPFDEEWRAARQ